MSEEVILITGVSGFVGSNVAKLLLEEGHRVRGTVRSLENEAKVTPIKNLVPDAKFPIELFAADLTSDEGWDKALENCTKVIHTASLSGEEAEGLVEATTRFLTACTAAKTITRIVITSCSKANYAESTPEPDKVYNEESWTDVNSTTIDAYSKSKAAAEKAAWDYLKELPDDQKFELATINPVLIMGPPLLETHKNATSVGIMNQLVNKTVPGVVRISFPVCDVRDVARAHIKAMTVPEAAGNRHIIQTENIWMKDMAMIVSKEFRPQGYAIPTTQLPYFVCWLASCVNKGMRNNVLPRIGKVINVDNSRMREVLGVEPTPINDTLHDMVYAMVDLGISKKAKKYKQVGSRAEVPAVNGEVEEEKKEEVKEEENKKELEPEDKEEKKDGEIKEDKPAEQKEEEKKEETGGEEKKETEAEK